MHKVIIKAVRKLNIALALVLTVVMTAGLGGATYVFASATSNFTQTINPGTLAVDIVDGSYATVASPTMAMNAATFSFACQTNTGSFGSATQQIFISNPNAANNGWVVSLAASATTDVWNSAGTNFDFNDPGTSGCTDDGATTDADTLGGQMTVDPSGATLAVGQCLNCSSTNVTLGSSASFVEGITNTITIVSGSALSDDIGDWTVQGVGISQKIPAEQPAATDYNMNTVLSIVAN